MSDELTHLPNIGTVLAQKLHQAGINGYEGLAGLGSVEAYLRIWQQEGIIGYNMLFALEGAIQGVRWHDLSLDQRRQVREELVAALASQSP